MQWTFTSRSATGVTRLRSDFMSILRAHANPHSDFDAAELIFGELIGNCVTHAAGPIVLWLKWDGEHPALVVQDRYHAFASQFSLPDDPLQENGRGLFIVHALARSIEINPLREGTQVTAVLPVWRSVGHV